MRVSLTVNHVLVILFAVSSGLFKVFGGKADVELFAKMGMSPTLVAAFGLIQAAGGLGLIFTRTSRQAAIVVALCNALATVGLFVAGVQPFGAISILFVGMALAELKLGGGGIIARPTVGHAHKNGGTDVAT